MSAALRRNPARRTVVCALTAALLALPASAAAKHAAPLAGAKLDSLAYTLAINTSRCPGPSDPAAATCAHLNLKSTFQSGPTPAARRITGQGEFPAGLRISGNGQSQCSSESPVADPIMLPDGAIQYVGSAIRVASSSLRSTDLLVASGTRGVRFAWPEPLDPAAPCKYFGGMSTAAFPQGGALPRSPLLPPATLNKRHFTTTIEAAAVEFQNVEPDGTYVYGDASWKLVLRYKR